MVFWKNNKQPTGQLLLEILISIGIFMIFVGGFMLFAADASRFTTFNAQQLQGRSLGAESYDALNDIWTQDFILLTNGTHGLVVDAQNEWTLSPTPDVHNELERQIIISDAFRDGVGSLTATGTPDSNTKKIVATIINTTTGAQIFSDTYYFSNINGVVVASLSWLQTTRNDFIGTHQNTQRTNLNGGALELKRNKTQGTFTSQIFDTGSDTTTYSQLLWNGIYDQLSDIKIQVRVGGTTQNIENESFFGPDGTSTTYFAPSDTFVIPPGVPGTHYIQYQVELTKSGSIILILEDIEIFYEL